MKNVLKLASVSALALMLAAPAYAQVGTVGNQSLDDRIDDIQTDVADALADGDDAARFGDNRFAQGFSGSASLGLSATSGNTKTGDLSFGGRIRYGAGLWNHSLGFAGQIAEDGNVRNKEDFFVTYEANRYFNDQFYVFGTGQATYDGFGTNRVDAFLGFGPGYRAINTEQMTWRVQAGPGVRYLRKQTGVSDTETAGIASSRFFYKFTDVAFLTNDTDVLFSSDNTRVINDIGVTLKVSDALSTRVSYRTDYNSDPVFGKKHTDNTLGVSLVYGF